MPKVSPQEIIEHQLELLKKQSDRGLLTLDETSALEKLIKLEIILKMKSKDTKVDDELAEITTADLKALLPLLS